MAGKMPEHNLLTPGYWRDSVRYEGKTIPGGIIGCEALNISDVLREKFAQASRPLRETVQAIGENRLTEELLRPAKNSVLQMIQLSNDSLRFYRADAAYYSGDCQDGGVGHSKAQHFFCRTAIRYIQHLPAARLLKSAVVPFEFEALGE